MYAHYDDTADRRYFEERKPKFFNIATSPALYMLLFYEHARLAAIVCRATTYTIPATDATSATFYFSSTSASGKLTIIRRAASHFSFSDGRQ